MYSTNVNGERLEFGTSGLLYRSNKLMYDRATRTLWNQFTGKPAVGELAGSGIELELLPVLVTTWAEWLKAHPDTTTLSSETGLYPAHTYPSEWEPRSIYFHYRESPDTMFPVWQRSRALSTKGQVLGLNLNGSARAYPLRLLEEHPLINDTLGGETLVIVTAGAVGSRVYQRGDNRFLLEEGVAAVDAGATILTDDSGRLWRVAEAALIPLDSPVDNPAGNPVDNPPAPLPRLPSHTAYWFGWHGFYPESDVYATRK